VERDVHGISLIVFFEPPAMVVVAVAAFFIRAFSTSSLRKKGRTYHLQEYINLGLVRQWDHEFENEGCYSADIFVCFIAEFLRRYLHHV